MYSLTDFSSNIMVHVNTLNVFAYLITSNKHYLQKIKKKLTVHISEHI